VSRVAKIFAVSLILVLILIVSITGTVFAAEGKGVGTQNQGAECLCGECPCGECPCDGAQLQTRTQSENTGQISNPDPENGKRNQKRTRSSWIVD